MQKLTVKQRVAVLNCLVEGVSINATVRITGITKKAILGLLVRAGDAFTDYQDSHLRNLPCEELQLDEIWSFVGCKEASKRKAVAQHHGDIWTWTAICAHSKLIPTWRVGDRTARTGSAFCEDLAARVKGDVQITSDGHTAYRQSVGMNFREANFAQLVKIYGQDADGKDTVIGIEKHVVQGTPDEESISTSYVERANLTIRMGNRRFTRLTNAFSKKVANHCHMLAIQFMHYNFARKHLTLKATPAQAAGVTDHQFTTEELVGIIDAYATAQEERAFLAAFEAKYTRSAAAPAEKGPQPAEYPWNLDARTE